jgi:MOSC domain-containing protein YiiM
MAETPHVMAVCISEGGIPKQVIEAAEVSANGLEGDGHDHDKHNRPHRAVLIQDMELLADLEREGFPVAPGVLGENLTTQHLDVQHREVGTRLEFEAGPTLELTEPRKPCFVLDQIHPDLQEAVAGRGGFLARVIVPGRVFVGQRITVSPPQGS